jgi:hypothetical protein
VIPDDAIFTRVGATSPDLSAKKKRAGLDRHVPIGIDGAGDGNLVEEIKEIQVFIEHDGGAENGVGSSLIKFLKSVG